MTFWVEKAPRKHFTTRKISWKGQMKTSSRDSKECSSKLFEPGHWSPKFRIEHPSFWLGSLLISISQTQGDKRSQLGVIIISVARVDRDELIARRLLGNGIGASSLSLIPANQRLLTILFSRINSSVGPAGDAQHREVTTTSGPPRRGASCSI